MNFGNVFMAFFMGTPLNQEEFDTMFDDSFIRYFKDNPNGYEEVMKAVNEQVPEDIREGILERFNRLYEQSKKGGNDDSDVH
jgi:hypothetical protein